MTSTKNGNHSINDESGSKCGQSIKPERIDRQYFSKQLQNIFNIDKGFLYTTKELFIRPGKVIQEFLFENRDKHVKPFAFLIFTSIIFSFITYFFNIEYSYLNINKIKGLQNEFNIGDVGEWLNDNIGYTNLIIGCFIALWVKIFVRNYNIYEIIVMLCFVLGETTFILSIAFAIGRLTNMNLIILGGIFIFFLYPIWAIGQFFGKKKPINYFKSLIVITLGNTSYLLFFIMIGYIYKILQN